MASQDPKKLSIGFVGLGAMGFGMASNLLLRKSHTVIGYDIYRPSAERFQEQGGRIAQSPKEVATTANFFVCMAATAQQADDIFFSPETGAAKDLPRGATILLCSTVPPTYHESLLSRLAKVGRCDVLLVDAPVSGGTKRAAEGALTIFASGTREALDKADRLLHDMSEKLCIIPGGPGAASKVKMINQHLVGTHIVASAEAMGFAAKAGLNTRGVYDIITKATGNSWAFENRVPHMLDGDWTPLSALNIFVKDMGIVVSTARTVRFPVPLASTAEQLYILAAAQGYGLEDDAGVIRVFSPNAVKESSRTLVSQQTSTPSSTPLEISKLGFVGLGATGSTMASSICRAGFPVCGYDYSLSAIEKFASQGGNASAARSPADAAKGAEVLVLMVQTAAQVTGVLFDSGMAADALPNGSIVILCSTVAPSFVRDLGKRLSNLGKGLTLIDAPVSSDVVHATNNTLPLQIICSGDAAVISRVRNVLLSITGIPKNLFQVQGGVGAASTIKLINNLLAGVHLAAAAEAMAFAIKLGLNTRSVFEHLKNAAAWSWMFENHVTQMLEEEWITNPVFPLFVNDLSIVLDEARQLSYYAPVASTAHTLYLASASRGWSEKPDAGIVRLWEAGKTEQPQVSESAEDPAPAGKWGSVPIQLQPLPAQETFNSLPPEYTNDMIPIISQQISDGSAPVLVVLDDDPTGTQTCHDINILTVWDTETLRAEFESNSKGFFILTNSRALPPSEARKLILEICQNVKSAAEKIGKPFEVVLRGDSTLRGHLPEEPEAVEEVLGSFDGWIIAPFFFQGGRHTIRDIHYVREGNVLVPASQTAFAQDATFGFKSSNLRDYIIEKCGGRFKRDSFVSVSIEDIRVGGPSTVTAKLLSAKCSANTVVIVNAVAESDMLVFVTGLLQATRRGRRYLYRTGAAFVSSRLAIAGIPPLTLAHLGISPNKETHGPGGLIIAGSYVPKTTTQLEVLLARRGDKLHVIELDVSQLISSSEATDAIINSAAHEMAEKIGAGQDTLIMTSRTLIRSSDALGSLSIGSKVAAALVRLVVSLEVRPRYIIAKGGITSSDAATKGLKMRRARVLGQAAPGVPLWRCDEVTSRHPGVPYVVFPGNVGLDSTLADVVETWSIN